MAKHNPQYGFNGKAYLSTDYDPHGDPGKDRTAATWGSIDIRRGGIDPKKTREVIQKELASDGEWATSDVGRKSIEPIDITILNDPTNTAWQQLNEAFESADPVGLMILDKAVATPGARGVASLFKVSAFSDAKELNDYQVNVVTLVLYEPGEIVIIPPSA